MFTLRMGLWCDLIDSSRERKSVTTRNEIRCLELTQSAKFGSNQENNCSRIIFQVYRQNAAMKKSIATGFTMVELMIVMVVIGVLAAIAYPSYTKFMVQTRRSDAESAL